MKIMVAGHAVAARSALGEIARVRSAAAEAMRVVPQKTYMVADDATMPAAAPQPANVYTWHAIRGLT